MLAAARKHVTDHVTRAANDDFINGGSCTRTKYTYDANGNQLTRDGVTQTWASFNLPTVINASGGVSATFTYGPDHQRKQQTAVYVSDGDSGTETTTYVGGLYEFEITPAQQHNKYFVQVPGGTQIIYDIQSVSGAQTTYITADHLGSASAMISSSGSLLLKQSYDAYGRRRTSNWSADLAATASDYTTFASTTRRGYTDAFHENLDNVALIHMNGRVYDPVSGRFLSPDPVVTTVGDSQSSNPYSYVENRPLVLTDPTGLKSGCNGITCKFSSVGGQFRYRNLAGLENGNLPSIDSTISPVSSGIGGSSWDGSTDTGDSLGDQTAAFGDAASAAVIAALDSVTYSSAPSSSADDSSSQGAATASGAVSNNGGAQAQSPGSGGSPVLDASGNPIFGINPDGSGTPLVSPAGLPLSTFVRQGQMAFSLSNSLDPYGIGMAAGAVLTADDLYGFRGGGPLDAQMISGTFNNQYTAYANFAFGVYTAAAGLTMDQALAGANWYASSRSNYVNSGYVFSSTYTNLPQQNVDNITNGYRAYVTGAIPNTRGP